MSGSKFFHLSGNDFLRHFKYPHSHRLSSSLSFFCFSSHRFNEVVRYIIRSMTLAEIFLDLGVSKFYKECSRTSVSVLQRLGLVSNVITNVSVSVKSTRSRSRLGLKTKCLVSVSDRKVSFTSLSSTHYI